MKKHIKTFVTSLVCFMSFSLIGCSQSSGSSTIQKDVNITEISFSLETNDVYVGLETFIKNVKVLPENATNRKLSWSVLDDTIAVVNGEKVKGLKAGTTKVIAASTDGSNVKKEVDITVKPLAKPSGWELDTSYCFYVKDSFTPNIKFYPDYPYIDKTCTYEVVDGADVLKVENGKISALKSGQGKVKVQSLANPELVDVINCVADTDLFSAYKVVTATTNVSYSMFGEKDGRISVLDISAPITKGGWPYVVLDIGEMRKVSTAIIKLDAKLKIGPEWFSLRLFNNDSVIAELGAEPCGGKPNLNYWTSYVFDFSTIQSPITEFNRIIITLCGDSDTYKGPERKAEVIFDNLAFQDFVENPTGMHVNQKDFILGVGKTNDVSITFEPEFVINREVEYIIDDSGKEVVDIQNGKLHGLKVGSASIKVISKGNPSLVENINVYVSDAKLLLFDIVPNTELPVNHVFYKEKDNRECVLSVSAKTTISDTYPALSFKLDKEYDASKTVIEVDTKYVSGVDWYSLTLTYGNNPWTTKIQEIGYGPSEEEDHKNNWISNRFEFTEDKLASYLFIRINTQRLGSESDVELLFNNIRIYEKD